MIASGKDIILNQIFQWYETIEDQDLKNEYSYCHHVYILFKVKLSDLMNIYLIQNPNKMKVNYEEKDILAVIFNRISLK